MHSHMAPAAQGGHCDVYCGAHCTEFVVPHSASVKAAHGSGLAGTHWKTVVQVAGSGVWQSQPASPAQVQGVVTPVQ